MILKGGENLKFNSKLLIELQEAKFLSNYRLAKMLGVHQTTIKNWRDGKKPRLEHLCKLCSFFDISPGQLFVRD